MSSPVSPRQRDIGEVASLRAEGVDPTAAKRLFCKLAKLQRCFLPNPSACGTSPIRAQRGRGGHCYASTSPRHKLPNYPRSTRQRRTLLRSNRAFTNFTARLPIFTAPASTLFFQSMLRLFNWISNCLIFCCNCSTLGNSRSISANCTLS